MGFFDDNDENDIRWQLERVGGYDKQGNVFSIARPLTGSVSFPIKTFPNADALEQFINEYTFFGIEGVARPGVPFSIRVTVFLMRKGAPVR
ncbi:MAG: hypothetical protein L3J98_17655 [Gammaproteobacteria bacterium]|nr:hypothetical protein [Gammaproteobacteria bacterium]MCF6261950.1 hypothetical protein [Gammaproteobacteria bacterium]